MPRAKKPQIGLYLSKLSNFFFKGIFFLINFFVFVGELTRKVLALPIIIFIKSIQIVSKGIIITFRRMKEIRVRLPSFPVIQLPQLRKNREMKEQESEGVSMVKSEHKFKRRAERQLRFFQLLTIKLKYLVFGSFLTLMAIFIYQSYVFVKNLPSPENIGKVNYSLSTHIVDRNGKPLYEIYRDQNRTPIKLKDLPSYVTQATIAMEDKDFYRHNGISFVGGMLRAFKDSLTWGNLQGGSTITQQLVKSSLLSPERTIERKIKEILLALWTERLYTKDQILEMYFNQVPYGGSSYGIEEAAQTYLHKSARDLTLSEAALLAGLPQAPTLYSPYVNPSASIARRNETLTLMKNLNYISHEQMLKSQLEPLTVEPIATKIEAPHFVFYVKSQLEDQYGIKEVEEGGLQVTTSLDLDIQREAEKILTEELEKVKSLNISNGAILVTRPQTGEILAMVGSADYFATPSGAFNVTTALRQPGSSIKPIMYSLALEKGFTAASIIDDSPVSFTTPGGQPYRPVNYDGRFHGRIPLRLALANSFNIPAVKVLNSIGVNNFVAQAQRMGISTWNDSARFGLSLTLGGGEVRMTDMATAYGALANMGNKVELQPVIRLENAHRDSIYNLTVNKSRVLNEGISYIISDILSDNFARQLAFGQKSQLEIPGYKVAVKTGTTDEKKDNWTIGYTPEFMVTVWVGNNDNTPMNRQLASGVTGAAPIWNRVMTYLLKNYGNNNTWYSKPDNVIAKNCYFGRNEYFLQGTENSVNCRNSAGPTPTPR